MTLSSLSLTQLTSQQEATDAKCCWFLLRSRVKVTILATSHRHAETSHRHAETLPMLRTTRTPAERSQFFHGAHVRQQSRRC